MSPISETIFVSIAQNLKCSICLETFTEPLTLCCGHSYCLKCLRITSKHRKGVTMVCPQCRVEMDKASELKKNVVLCNIVNTCRDIWDQINNLPKTNDYRNVISYNEFMEEDDSLETLKKKLMFFETKIKKIEEIISTKYQCKEFSRLPLEGAEVCGTFALGSSNALNDQVAASMSTTGLESKLDRPNSLNEEEQGAYCPDGASPEVTEHSEEPSTHTRSTEGFSLLTFSPRLAHRHLTILQRDRRVETRSRGAHSFGQDRFDVSQWMAKEEFSSGEHYWDVDVAKSKAWAVGVAYTSLGRGDLLGRNIASWCLEMNAAGQLAFWHNEVKVCLHGDRPCSVRVKVDLTRRTLTFYSLSDCVTVIHHAEVMFTAPVSPVFWLYGLTKHSLYFPDRDNFNNS